MNTPYFTIHKNDLQTAIDNLHSTLHEYWNNYICGYSFKTNSLPYIVNYMKKNNFYAEVVSDDEYNLAIKYGYEKNRIIYNGMLKSKESFLEALSNKAIVNIDTQREIDWLSYLNPNTEYEVGIRVNCDIESMCIGETSAGQCGSRFGFCYENGELLKAIEKINLYKNIKLVGLHLHVGSKTRSLNIYKAIATKLLEIAKTYNLNLKYLDIGGGFFGGVKGKPTYLDYVKAIKDILCPYFKPESTCLIIEPGISIIGPYISYTSSIIDIKNIRNNIIAVSDGSRCAIDPLMHKTNYDYTIIKNSNSTTKIDFQRVVGYTCIENDIICDLKNELQLSLGDKIVYNKVGAYTMCLSPLFIKYYPDVYVLEDQNYYKVRSAWTVDEYSKNSKVDL